MASFTITSITANSVTIKVSGITSGTKLKFPIRYVDATSTIQSPEETATGPTHLKTLYGLTPSTQYATNVGIWVSNAWSWIGTQTFTTSSGKTRPSNWYWSSTVASGYPINISATDWNNFTARINSFRSYAGLTTYSFTRVYSGTAISASIVNQAVYAIGSIPGHGSVPSAVYSGDTIRASFFNSLRSALNAIP